MATDQQQRGYNDYNRGVHQPPSILFWQGRREYEAGEAAAKKDTEQRQNEARQKAESGKR